MELDGVDGVMYGKVLDVWCGNTLEEKELGDMLVLASVADRLEMMEVGAALEEAIIRQLSVGVCGDVLMASCRLGLGRVEAAARELGLERFEELTATRGFMEIDEEVMGSLLEDDGLCVSKEEAAFEGLVGWMKGGGGELRGRGLLSKIRFGLMDQEYLTSRIQGTLGEWIDGLVADALRVQRGEEGREVKGPSPRIGWGVRWERYEVGGGRTLQCDSQGVNALAECEGRMCSGLSNGSIRVWNKASLQQERTLYDNEGSAVLCLTTWDGLLIGGHDDGRIAVWNVVTGERVTEQKGHTSDVFALAVSGLRLASGSSDNSVKVWAIGAGAAWSCERTLAHGDWVTALATWRDKVVSGSKDGSISVWALGTGTHDATLAGHDSWVEGLVAHGDRLLSSARDGTIREWAMGTWAPVRTVEVYARGAEQYSMCLAVSGSKLLSGSSDPKDGHKLRVLDLQTLACEHTLVQPSGEAVWCLAAARGEAWGGVGVEVVVWGRD